MTEAEQVAQALGQAVLLGDQPTDQELELGREVAAHLTARALQVEDDHEQR